MTAEQATAFTQLRLLVAPDRLRVVPDTEGWPVVPGRLGRVEYHDGKRLAVYSDRPRLFARLLTIPGVRRWQTGDREMRALFSVEALEQVAGVIRARRRRQGRPMTSEAARALAARARSESVLEGLPAPPLRPEGRPLVEGPR